MSATPWAEVIGDPIGHSLSPFIHRHWLASLAMEGCYEACRVRASGLGEFFRRRAADPSWRGCNVTLPHKAAVMPLLQAVDAGARKIGAVNCVYRSGGQLVGCNSDVAGIAAALKDVDLSGAIATVIGAGGAASAAVEHLAGAGCSRVHLLVRDPARAAPLARRASVHVEVQPIDQPDAALSASAIIINASPLGMAGAPRMPQHLLDAVCSNASASIVFDMVYAPLDTAFLAASAAGGGESVDGLSMLIGQARLAFRLFFGRAAPDDDRVLTELLERKAKTADADDRHAVP